MPHLNSHFPVVAATIEALPGPNEIALWRATWRNSSDQARIRLCSPCSPELPLGASAHATDVLSIPLDCVVGPRGNLHRHQRVVWPKGDLAREARD